MREFYFGHCRTRSKCTIILDKLIIKALVYGELKTRALNRTFEDSHAWRELVYVETHMPFGMKKGEPCIKLDMCCTRSKSIFIRYRFIIRPLE